MILRRVTSNVERSSDSDRLAMRGRVRSFLSAALTHARGLWWLWLAALARQLGWDRVVEPINSWIDETAVPVIPQILRAVVDFVTVVPGLGVIVLVVILILLLSYWETRLNWLPHGPKARVGDPGSGTEPVVESVRAQEPSDADAVRRFLDDAVTPAYLVRLLNAQGNAAVKPFIGNWMRIAGMVDSANESQTSDSSNVALTAPDGVPIHAYFGPTWLSRVRILVPGARVAVAGRLDFVLSYLALERCELIDDSPARAEPAGTSAGRRPLTLPQKCVRLADEIEAEVGRRDHLPFRDRRAGDASYREFVDPLRDIEEELRVVAHMPVDYLATIQNATDLGRVQALEMVRALRGLVWGGDNGSDDAVPPARYYVGNGSWYQDIPARDLTQQEYGRLTAAQRQLVDTGQIYSATKPNRTR